MLAGGCHCGAVRFETDGTPFHETVCHCVDCRRATGAASVAWFSVPSRSVRWLGTAPWIHRSSAAAARLFCGQCGTSLAYRADAHPEEIDLAMAALDDPEQVRPKDHLFVSQKPSWVVIGDGLPQYARRREDG